MRKTAAPPTIWYCLTLSIIYSIRFDLFDVRQVVGPYSGSLGNGGDRLVIIDANGREVSARNFELCFVFVIFENFRYFVSVCG
jgi:hypothetical protein